MVTRFKKLLRLYGNYWESTFKLPRASSFHVISNLYLTMYLTIPTLRPLKETPWICLSTSP
jgi:hypothetical protein